MGWYTFGQMLHAIELGQVAEAADGERRMKLLPEGMVWLNGPYAGGVVRVQGYLFSDLWTIREDDPFEPALEERANWKRKQMEMLENQLFEQRARRFESPNIEEKTE
ncbi:hypothetical protein [Saccharibacillus brassicae]|uniref:Uncharacterized protein n=1 Tax=Saccharibacillus brassicae TaxID=2583377 RepID=A0A4Y6UX23_SACBS|nr:hypothetical protein [Saccharibacillus brassicae]QDH22253.1 hypothetical protein FFV09_16215 [Saccharibacillus brassicae]